MGALIDHRNTGQRSVLNPLRQREREILAAPGIVERLKGWRGAAQDDHGAALLRPYDGHIARMIPRRFFLLIRGVVLLINDDQTEIVQRRKDRRAGANRNARLTTGQAPPLVEPFAGREPAVEHGNL